MDPSSSSAKDELDVTATVGAADGVSLGRSEGRVVVVVVALTTAAVVGPSVVVVELPEVAVGGEVVCCTVVGVVVTADVGGNVEFGLFVVSTIVGDNVDDDTAEGERSVVGATEGCGTAGSGGKEEESGVYTGRRASGAKVGTRVVVDAAEVAGALDGAAVVGMGWMSCADTTIT